MKRSDIITTPDYYTRYINLVDDEDLMILLPKGGIHLLEQDLSLLQRIGLQTYEEGKWTVNQIVEHLIDTERIFLNRALRFARKDQTNLPGYEENDYAETARSNDRDIVDLINEYKIVREGTTYFFKHLNREQLLAEGTANGQRISVLAMGFILIGHPIHHHQVILERYAPLVV